MDDKGVTEHLGVTYHPEIIHFENKLSGKDFFQYLAYRFFQIKTEYARAVNTVLKRGTERHLINTHIVYKLSM